MAILNTVRYFPVTASAFAPHDLGSKNMIAREHHGDGHKLEPTWT
jgi:hypothetical protein